MDSSPSRVPIAPGPLLVVTGGGRSRGEALAETLGFTPASCTVTDGAWPAEAEDALFSVVPPSALLGPLSPRWSAVVLDGSGSDQIDVLDSALKLLQAVMALDGASPQVILATGGSQRAEMRDPEAHDPEHAGLWGLARAARMESADLRVSCVDLDGRSWTPKAPSQESSSPAAFCSEEAELCSRTASAPGEDDRLLAARLARSKVAPQRPLRLHMPRRGSLTNLRPVPQSKRAAPKPGELEVRVAAIGLNFRDVLNVMGLYPGPRLSEFVKSQQSIHEAAQMRATVERS